MSWIQPSGPLYEYLTLFPLSKNNGFSTASHKLWLSYDYYILPWVLGALNGGVIRFSDYPVCHMCVSTRSKFLFTCYSSLSSMNGLKCLVSFPLPSFFLALFLSFSLLARDEACESLLSPQISLLHSRSCKLACDCPSLTLSLRRASNYPVFFTGVTSIYRSSPSLRSCAELWMELCTRYRSTLYYAQHSFVRMPCFSPQSLARAWQDVT